MRRHHSDLPQHRSAGPLRSGQDAVRRCWRCGAGVELRQDLCPSCGSHAWSGLTASPRGRHQEPTTDAGARVAEALSDLEHGEHLAALSILDQVLDRESDWAAALTWRGIALLHLGRVDEAREAMERAVQLEPDGFFGWAALGQLLTVLGEDATALKALESALARKAPNKHARLATLELRRLVSERLQSH